ENTKVSDDSISHEHPSGFTPKEDEKELDHVDDNISEPKEDLQEVKDVNSTCSKLKSNSFNRKFVVDTWSLAPGDNHNDMRNLMKKLKFLKIKIEEWNFGHISSSRVEMKHLQEELNRVIAKGKDKMTRPVENRVSFDMEFPNSLSRAQQEELESDVTHEEIKRAV
nr:hypothetical protein [Tanacetum cinerariifolium]